MNSTQFGEAIRDAIKASGQKRTVLAQVAGIAESSVRAIEDGHCPSVIRADDLIRALGLELVLGRPGGPQLVIPEKARKLKRR